MRVLSLFDGIACGYEALQRAGIKIDAYYASEIDKYAIQIAKKNHPDIIEIGDVCEIKGENYQDIDLLIGGSPCQGFSVAGKMLNFNDPRSKLFFEYVRLLREVKPKYFLLENVKMKKEWQNIISRELGVEPIEINSSLVSAQSRKRLYRTNIPNITQPKDKGILLKDILEENVDEKYYLSDKGLKMLNRNFGSKGKALNFEPSMVEKITYPSRINQIEGGLDIKTPTLTASMGTGGGNVPCIVRGRPKMPYEPGHRELEYKVYSDKCPTLTENCASGDQKNIVDNGIRIRKLTPIECERLQTLPDDYTAGVSNTQRYKALGNGRTVDVIAHIFRFINQ